MTEAAKRAAAEKRLAELMKPDPLKAALATVFGAIGWAFADQVHTELAKLGARIVFDGGKDA